MGRNRALPCNHYHEFRWYRQARHCKCDKKHASSMLPSTLCVNTRESTRVNVINKGSSIIANATSGVCIINSAWGGRGRGSLPLSVSPPTGAEKEGRKGKPSLSLSHSPFVFSCLCMLLSLRVQSRKLKIACKFYTHAIVPTRLLDLLCKSFPFLEYEDEF